MAFAAQTNRDKKLNGSKAPWFAVWKDTDGKKHWLKVGKKADALEIARERERQAKRQSAGLIVDKPWKDFRGEYDKMILPLMRSSRSRESTTQALDLFEKLAKPCLVQGITTKTLQKFASSRASQPGKKSGDKVAAATIQKELRTIRAALAYAHQWQYLAVVPMMPRVEGFESEKRFVTPEHFGAMLEQCKTAALPGNVGYPASDWWDALLSLLWVAPNRITAMLALRWDDFDLEAGFVVTPAQTNKQKRDHRACVPAVVVEKLRGIKRFGEMVFPWSYGESTLYRQFFKIQTAAGIKLHCNGNHEHTEACHMYGFHDFRRSFATFNDELPASLKQSQMGHSTYATTQRYEKFAKQQATFAERLHLPEALQRKASG